MYDISERLRELNVCYDRPGKDHLDAMPTGNGDVAINVWTENEHDVIILIAKNDAWDESSVLCKIGKIKIHIPSEKALHEDESFFQELDLEKSLITIRTEEDVLTLWVDIHSPVVHAHLVSKSKKKITISLEWYRKEDQPLPWKTNAGSIFRNLEGEDPYPSMVYGDTLVDHERALAWYHWNEERVPDPFKVNMELQGLGDFINKMEHPLKGRTFGAWIEGENLFRAEKESLVSLESSLEHRFVMIVKTEHPSSPEHWQGEVMATLEEVKDKSLTESFSQHVKWWKDYWKGSYIFLRGDHSEEAKTVTQAYMVQRYQNACSSRGEFPIKFNGGLWTSIPRGGSYDFRKWGDGFWWQNQRMVYWPMFCSGDFELMKPFFDLYQKGMDLNIHKTKTYYGHPGAHFAETVYWWGSAASSHYGWTPFEDRESPEEECTYTRYYFQNNLERTLMMHEYYLYTQDEDFARDVLMLHAEQTTLFYDHHYQRKEGRIHFFPAQSLETWHIAEDPLPEIAGLEYLLKRLLSLPETIANDDQRDRWSRMLSELPELPKGEKNGVDVIAPARSFEMEKNAENPELYCVFPYRIYGLGKETDLELAKTTMEERTNRQQSCWCQNEIQQAYLGMTEEAKEGLLNRVKGKIEEASFPTYWQSFYDSEPCQDHAGGLLHSLQVMLLQCEGKDMMLFPAWPKEWDVDFKLHAPYQTTIEGRLRSGVLEEIVVSPESRRGDLRVCLPVK